MEPNSGTTWNDDVLIGKYRSIAARGLTPNHRGVEIVINGITGVLMDYEHFTKTTVATVLTDPLQRVVEFDLAHLDTVEVS